MRPYNYSGLTLARKCEQLYKYVYLDKLKSTEPMSGDMAFGTAMHLGVGAILEGEDGVSAFKLFWGLNKNLRFGRYGQEDLLQQGEILLERFKRLHLKKFKVIEMEKKLEATVDEIVLYGTPDVVGDFNGVPSIIDFKTSGYRYHKDRVLLSEQLYLYAFLWKQLRIQKIEQLVYFVFVKGKTPSIQTLITPFNETICKEILSELLSYCRRLDEIEKESGFLKNRGNCIMGEVKCDFFKVCYKEIYNG